MAGGNIYEVMGTLTGNLTGLSGNLKGNLTVPRSGGTTDYNALNNRPSINNVILEGNKTSHDIKVQDEMDEITKAQIDKIFMSWIRG